MNLFIAQILNVETGARLVGGDEEYREISDGLSKMRDLSQSLAGGAAQATRGNIPANFVRVEGGTFQMGTVSGGESNERPVRNVTVSSFHMSIHPVTQREWIEIMGTNPSYFRGDNLPVENVSWFDVIEYCNRRSQREGLTPVYSDQGINITVNWNANGYRLPTEAEWEFAAKGGNTAFFITEYSGSNNVDAVAWFRGNSGNRTHPVGTKAPNGLGLFDMSGNVLEWVWDWYGTYPSSAQTDPRGPGSGSYRVLRGGSWFLSAEFVRSVNRSSFIPNLRNIDIGFRLVRN
jgi:formylglycine-generating enzyme required for sulfatase activity